jgi:hypothetical protein
VTEEDDELDTQTYENRKAGRASAGRGPIEADDLSPIRFDKLGILDHQF